MMHQPNNQKVSEDTNVYGYDFLAKNRKEVLNLISVDEYKEKYL